MIRKKAAEIIYDAGTVASFLLLGAAYVNWKLKPKETPRPGPDRLV